MARKLSPKAEAKARDKRIEAAYYRTCDRIPIRILDISKVFKVGEAAVAEGVDDEVLGQRIRAFVETIRQDKPTTTTA